MSIRCVAILVSITFCLVKHEMKAQTCNTCSSVSSLNSGLVACYPLDGNANDMISAANNGVATSTVATTNRFGRSNAAFQFNGSAKIILPGSNFLLNNYTYSVWVKATSIPSFGNAYSILAFGNSGPLGDQVILLCNNYGPPNQIGFNAVSYTNPAIFPLPPDMAFPNTLPSTGTWYHVVSVRNTATGKIRLFINGVFITETSLSTTVAGYATPNIGVIGARGPTAVQGFNGTIDNVRIYNRALSNSEIFDLYNLADDTVVIANVGADRTICVGDSVQLNATTTGGTSYSWSPTTGLNNPSIANPYAKPSSTQQYIVTVSNGACSVTDTVIVNVNTNCCFTCTSPDAINTGLIACYPFSGNTNDETTINGNGTNSGATLTTDRYGNTNKAYNFNGSNSISIPSSGIAINTYTQSTWVKITTLPTSGNLSTILCIGNSGPSGDQCININNNYGGSTGFIASSYYASGADVAVTGVLPTVGVWYHLVSVRDVATNKIKLYVNGVKASESNLSTPIAGYATPVLAFIGARSPGNVTRFNGIIDDVRIYNRALSDLEIMLLYINNSPPTLTPISDKAICQGDSVQLTTSGGTTYSWSPTTGLNNPSIANPYAKPSSTQQYIVTVSNGNCSTTDTVIVNVSTNCCTTCSTPDPINTGLLACYPLNGAATDASGNNRDGTPTGLSYASDRFSNANQAGLFAGGAFSDITYAAFQVPQYTYSLWVKVAIMPASGSYFSAISIGNNSVDQAILIGNNSGLSHIGFGFASYNSDLSGVSGLSYTGSLPTPNIWYHIVVTRSNSQVNFYVNGVLVSTASTLGKTAGYGSSSFGALIGKRSGTASQNFWGNIDDVRIYNRVLSDMEISQLSIFRNIPTITPISDKSVCAGDSVQLTATGGTIYSWNPAATLSNSTLANPYAKPASNQQYIVNVSNGVCSNADTVIVNVNPNCCATCSTPDAINNGLVACYPFDANTNDASGNNIHGTATNITYTTDRFGNANKAISLNGTTSYVDITNTVFQLPQFTYSIWVNVPSFSAAVRSALSIGTGLTDHAILMSNTSGFGAASYNTDATFITGVQTGSSPATNVWHHIVIARSNSTLFIYMNGTLIASASVGGKAPGYGTTGYAALIGKRVGTTTQNFLGKIDDVRIYNKALSASEISDLFVLHNIPTITPISDKMICSGDSVQLTATGGTSYVWSPTTALSSSTIANPYAKPVSNQQYIVTVSNGICAAKDTVDVTLHSIPLTIGSVTPICNGDSIQLSASGFTSYLWTPSATLSNATVSNPFAKPTTTTKYHVTATAGLCVKNDSVTVNVGTLNLDAGLNKSICLGDSIQLTATGSPSYTWHTQATLSDSTIANPFAKPTTTQKYFVTGAQGTCTAIDSVTVTVSTINLDAGTGSNICKGDSIQLNATGAGTYTWSTKNTLSDSTIANAYAKPLVTTTYYVTGKSGACIAMDSVTLVVPTLNADAGANHQICPGDSIRLQASGGGTYKWQYNLTLSDTGISNPYAKPATTTKYYVVVSNGICSATDSATVTIASSIIVDAGLNKQICLGDSVQLGVIGAANYKWYYNLTLSDSTISNPFAKPTSKTTYFVLGTTGSCSALDSVDVDIATITADAGTNQSICGGDSIQLLATGGTSYKWWYNTTLSDSTIANPFARPATTTQYFVTVSTALCKAIDSVTVTISTTVNVDAGADQQLCQGDSVQLQAGGATTYTWLPIGGLSDPTISNPKASPTLTTDYIVKGQILTCVDYDTMRVTVNPIPTVDIGPDITKCINDTYTFNATVTNADIYTWSPAAELNDATILNPTTVTKIPQVFTLTVKNTISGCEYADTVMLNISNPKAMFTLSDTIIQHPPMVVTATNTSSPTPLMYQWFVNDSIPAYYNTLNPNHTFQFVGRYPVTLTVTDNLGCMDTFTRYVTVSNNLGIFIPNVFTPNGDGVNDVFQVTYDVANTLILTGTIWNRWGAQIYQFSIPSGDWWNGKADGIPASPDVYYYIITITDKQHKTLEYHGTVTLLR